MRASPHSRRPHSRLGDSQHKSCKLRRQLLLDLVSHELLVLRELGAVEPHELIPHSVPHLSGLLKAIGLNPLKGKVPCFRKTATRSKEA